MRHIMRSNLNKHYKNYNLRNIENLYLNISPLKLDANVQNITS